MPTFSNPRWDALPCELMRGCTFADDFLTQGRTEQNKGSLAGSGTFDHGFTSAGPGRLTYDTVLQTGNFSLKIQISASAMATANWPLFHSLDAGDGYTNGFAIYATATGIYAHHKNSGGGGASASLHKTFDYSDGEIHTITYVVDQDGGNHYLYVDDLDAETGSISITGGTGASGIVRIGSSGLPMSFYQARIFDAILTEAEHDVYHAGTLETFFMSPLAAYRCDDFCNDTDGHYIWDRTTNRRDLTKGDGSTSSTFPTFDTDKYLFDFVDDYVGGLFTLPTAYTVTAAKSTPQEPYPVIVQENDTTLLDDLTTGGEHWGYLHSLTIHTGVLTQLELYHAEYQHLYWLARGRASGLYHRLITEGTCKLAIFMDAGISVYRDHSLGTHQGTGHDVTREDDADGCSFGSADSHVLVDDDTTLRVADLTIAVYGTFTGSEAAGTIIDKGANYKFLTNGNQLDFNGSTISHTFANNQHIAVTVKSGFKPRFFVDGEYIGEGSTTETPDDTDTTDVTIGNNNETNSPTQYPIKQIYLGDKALSDVEVKALYEQAQVIGASDMETGTRTRVREVFTAVAVDEDVDPGGPFQLIEVKMIWNTAATTSEDIEITSINSDGDVVLEHSFDPSTSSRTSHVFRFDKRFADGTTIAIDYTNTDARTITVNTIYQTDPSIG